jgi:hypothetical protein
MIAVENITIVLIIIIIRMRYIIFRHYLEITEVQILCDVTWNFLHPCHVWKYLFISITPHSLKLLMYANCLLVRFHISGSINSSVIAFMPTAECDFMQVPFVLVQTSKYLPCQ